jgi:hypothetical protein
MVSVRVPGIYGWGNPSAQLPGVLGSSPYHRSGLGAPFLWGTRVVTTSPRQHGQGTQDGAVSQGPGAVLGWPDGLGSVLSGSRVLSA